MAWFRVRLTEDQQRIVNEERVAHPNPRVREKMLILWLLHCGTTREKAAEIAGIARATVQRYVAAFRAGGLDGLRRWDPRRPAVRWPPIATGSGNPSRRNPPARWPRPA